MPWRIEERDGEFCVIKEDDGEVEGCHATRNEAEDQRAALYASEPEARKDTDDGMGHGDRAATGGQEAVDEVKEDEIKMMDEYGDWVPRYEGVLSFAELDAQMEAIDAAEAVDELRCQFVNLVNNIMRDPEVDNKAGRIESLTGEFVDRLQEMPTKEAKATWTTKYVNDLPDSAFLFIESGGDKDGDGKTAPRSLRHFPYKDAGGKVDLPHLRNAIARIPQSKAKGLTMEKKRSLQERARNILSENQKEDGFIAWLKEKLGWRATEPEPVQDTGTGFTVWKEADEWRWLAVFSNNYRDDDVVPEIISKQAHIDFERAIDAGEWPKPELWFWHVPHTRFGWTDMLAYDQDTGFTVAMGGIDKERAHAAEYIAQMGDWLVSHGMHSEEMERDPDDPTIITRYRTREISPLPPEAAANKLTWFMTTHKENRMAIPEHKIEELRAAGFDPDELDAKLESERQRAESEEREAKETKDEAEVEAVEDAVESADVEEAQPEATETVAEPIAVAEPALSAQDITAAFQEAIGPVMERIEAVEAQFKALSEKETEREEKVKDAAEKLKMTPAASLGAMLRSVVIGADETYVDGRKARHDGPEETEADSDKSTGIPVVDALLSGKDWRDTLPKN